MAYKVVLKKKVLMSVVVKTHPTLKIEFRKSTPRRIMRDVYRRYSRYIVPLEEDQLVDWKKTDLHKEIAAILKPGDYLHNLRHAAGWTLRDLGEKIEVSAQRVYDYETGRRAISKEIAKKLSSLFNISSSVFI
jgi:DNA-binding XRE family transcriptional regulator